MKIDLSNQELIDIYSCIGSGMLSNTKVINELEGIEKLTSKIEEENERYRLLMSKIFNLIDWENA